MNRQIKIAVLAIFCAACAANVRAIDWKDTLGGLADKAAQIKDKAGHRDDLSPRGAQSDARAPDKGSDGSAASFRAYQNYDFVPGEKIVFEDDFTGDADGEFPAHWQLEKGQGAVNFVAGRPALALTDGNYARVTPRVRQETYLGNPFTIEFDFYADAAGYDPVLFLESADSEADVGFGKEVYTSHFHDDRANQTATYPAADAFADGWHHAALVFRNGQLKAYLDQYRVLVVPEVGDFKPESVELGGIGGKEHPVRFTNVRIANGGGMNLVEQLTRDGRLVTHGIFFDVGQSAVKPESMGTLRQIVAALKASPSLKLEIGGHTDSDGDASRNLTLSQARADAVRKVLVDQGIDASRLSTKGYGATKPIDSNSTPEGKANNRRVEFVKQ